MAVESGEFVVVPLLAHPQDSASEPGPFTDHRAPFANRDTRARLTVAVADTNGADVLARERGVPSREAIRVQNRTPPSWAYVSESNILARETGEPLLLLDKHRTAGVGVAVGFTRNGGRRHCLRRKPVTDNMNRGGGSDEHNDVTWYGWVGAEISEPTDISLT
ncbi:hypothetical protein OsJ_26270 [Oryza sativa Japonica Group]|uniref:Uncharacterized protein n=1 Tax=Oryza sativa subsp. japonica TaxID=39947 RepID=B9FZD9_ORYSJ|nr:hypothetical protein OsJ_26270 [Oryza sativa Japonica Group]